MLEIHSALTQAVDSIEEVLSEIRGKAVFYGDNSQYQHEIRYLVEQLESYNQALGAAANPQDQILETLQGARTYRSTTIGIVKPTSKTLVRIRALIRAHYADEWQYSAIRRHLCYLLSEADRAIYLLGEAKDCLSPSAVRSLVIPPIPQEVRTARLADLRRRYQAPEASESE